MKICYICGGNNIHMQRWVNYFARRGHEVHLISHSRLRVGGGQYEKEVQIHPLIRLFPRIWKVSGYLSGVLWLIQVQRLLREIKPNIVDAHYITVNGYLAASSDFHPLVLTAWGSDILIVPKQNPVHRFLTKHSLKKADLVICDSETLRTGLLELGVKSTNIEKIFNGIDTQQFNPQWKNKKLKAALGILEDAPVVICIRHLKTTYNVEMLIRAIPLVLKQEPQTIFIIGGNGEQEDYLKNLASSLGVSSAIRFVGWIPHDELPKYLASSDVYVSTSLSDSTSLSLQEAMACELPPVVTDLPANREWVTDGENGFIVPSNDVSALAIRILYLLRNKEVSETFGKTGRKIIAEKAEYKKEMGKVEDLYQELVKK
jgi:glycosyltransferase involved in cell wall biosynthesis